MGSGLGVYAQGTCSVVGGVGQAVPVGPALQRAAIPKALPAADRFSRGIGSLYGVRYIPAGGAEVEVLVVPQTEHRH